MYMSVRNIDVVSVPCCVVMYMGVRNIDAVSVPCEWSCICVSGILMLSLFLVSGHVYICVRNIDVAPVHCEWSCIYVYQEYRCCLCSM